MTAERTVVWFWPDAAALAHAYRVDRVEAAREAGEHVHNGHRSYRSLCRRWIKHNGDLVVELADENEWNICRTCLKAAGGMS